ncbi:two-component system, OmpR family, phosphate regulon sensor histidine kinase PhoR [Methylacidimicrobium cyclopophantes]|uniref:histidine kinase n=1 Tax=Methylacidimicrobium cyclopophantes TaxID=1041766 RepID=A0A5E6M9J0_9BACT|nr:ATP-binding protein [Methylacidimicrobium cyclopophantes]VVM04968.1 two-component system, OmpR family, phosphate regulon sensor histidine kinase PhoR [Methylacidimicrobium cyclopophantes]
MTLSHALIFLLGLALAAALLQLFAWARSAAKLERIAEEIVHGRRPRSFVIFGPRSLFRVASRLETILTAGEKLSEQVEQQGKNFHGVLRNMMEGVAIIDRDHRVELANEALVRQFGLGSEPSGRTVLESLRIAEIDRLISEAFARQEARSGEISLRGFPNSHADLFLIVNAVPMQSKPGVADQVLLVLHDITEHKRNEERQKEFLANVSHELRTPLSIFRGYVETLLNGSSALAPEEVQRVLKILRRHSLRLSKLVNDLLTLSALEPDRMSLERSPVSLPHFLRRIESDLRQPLQEKRIGIEIDLPQNLPKIDADPFRLEQVFYNLVENAIQYSEPGSPIRIRARPEGNLVSIQVIDQGVGISPRDLPHVFERFYRVDKTRSREAGGTGLGLSIVQRIVDLHHGRVQIASEPGKGTTVTVLLPAWSATLPAGASAGQRTERIAEGESRAIAPESRPTHRPLSRAS